MPADNLIGFAAADWALVLITALLLTAAFAWRPGIQNAFDRLAHKTRLNMLLLFLLPIALRLLLLPNHPVPAPESPEEFSHLLMADTLMKARLANPPHPLPQFFETFSVIQQPTYSSTFPLGLGLTFAIGRILSGTPWAGVLISSGALCAFCYWMLRGWVTAAWALLGGILAAVEFGPLCQWTNSYAGGSLAAAAGCLIFGALPRLRISNRPRDAALLGLGFGLHLLTARFESILVLLSLGAFFALTREWNWRRMLSLARFSLLTLLPAMLLILLQTRAVTRTWTTLPEQMSQYQYGVPASLTFQANPIPHRSLTPPQQNDYRTQLLVHGPGPDTVAKFLQRLEYRVRYYRFFFLPALYLAVIAFLFTLRERPTQWIAVTLAIFALGTNLFPFMLVQYLSAATCLFVLVSILGLQQISHIRIHNIAIGLDIACVLIVLALGEFGGWYALHLFETPASYPLLEYETWDVINHRNPQRRLDIQRQLAVIKDPVVVFVRYSAHHAYQYEWVWNKADIDNSLVVYARDLGPQENQKLIDYYPRRKALLLEPDGLDLKLSPY